MKQRLSQGNSCRQLVAREPGRQGSWSWRGQCQVTHGPYHHCSQLHWRHPGLACSVEGNRGRSPGRAGLEPPRRSAPHHGITESVRLEKLKPTLPLLSWAPATVAGMVLVLVQHLYQSRAGSVAVQTVCKSSVTALWLGQGGWHHMGSAGV